MYVVHIEKSPRSYTFHLGNVRALVSDVKAPLLTSGAVYRGEADVLSYNNYYPFGMLQPQRNYNATDYRYGFNGKEKDDEIKGSGNSYDYGARIYDPRLGRWMSVDALAADYPSYSPYNYAINNPIIFMDPDGKKVKALSKETRRIIKLSLTPDESKYVKFNRKGMIKEKALARGLNRLGEVGGNYEALLTLVKADKVYEVNVASSVDLYMVKGDPSTLRTENLPAVQYDVEADVVWEEFKEGYEEAGKTKEDFIKDNPDYSTEKKVSGTRGIALTSKDDNGGLGYTKTENNETIINPTQTEEDQVENLGHELYGHQYYDELGEKSSHGSSVEPGNPNTNAKLEKQIKSREKESKANYKKHKTK